VSHSQPPDLIAQIRAELAKHEARPGLSKASADPKCTHRSKAHAAFVAAVDFLLTRPGWSLRAISREMSCDHTSLRDWLERGDQRSSQIPAWAFAALPAEAQPVLLRHMLGWVEGPVLGRTG
jgi:lambda repressor-like predicted transcriptional regulator